MRGAARLTLVLGAVMATGPLAVDMYLPSFPALQAQFGVEHAAVQHTLSAYLLGLALGQLGFGPLTDRYGRKPPLVAGLALFGAASVGCALATSIDALIALRFVQALGGSAGMVVIRAVIRDRFDALQGARMLSLMMLVMGVAPILAPLAGGWILVNASWSGIFWLLAAFAALCATGVLAALEESHHPGARSGSLAAAAAGLAPVLADWRFLAPALLYVGAFGAFFAYLAGAPFVFIQHFGVAAEDFGWYFGANAIAFIGMSQLNRRVLPRFGPRRLLGAGVAVLGGAAVALALAAASGAGGLPAVFVPLFFGIGSLGLIVPNATAVAMGPFGERAGAASSLLGSLQALGGVAASAAVGAIPATGARPMAGVFAGCAAVAVGFWLPSRGRR